MVFFELVDYAAKLVSRAGLRFTLGCFRWKNLFAMTDSLLLCSVVNTFRRASAYGGSSMTSVPLLYLNVDCFSASL